MPDDRVELERAPSSEEAPLLRPGYPRAPGYPDAMPYGYGNAHNEEDENSINLREIWRIIRKRKLLIVCVTVIVTTLVTIEAYRTKSTYKASAFIEIGKDTPRVRSAADGMVMALAESLGVSNSLIELPSLRKRVLAAVYLRAELLLLPSEEEGFDLPVVESMAAPHLQS